MAHVIKNGKAGWATPRVIVKVDGKDIVLNNVSNGTPFARAIAYIVEAMEFSNDKVNRFLNKTARESAHLVKEGLTGNGKPGDVFTYAMPTPETVATDDVKYVNVMSTTRADILKACESIISVDAIMSDAEAKADEVRTKAGDLKVNNIAPMPVYSEGAGVRGKKSAGTFRI